MVIQHNMAAMFANREQNVSEKKWASSAEKLSSGYRINRAADDAAGLTISEKMRWQIRGLDKASNNIEDGMSLIQVADGALNESHAVLQRMNELAVQAANDTNTDADRDAIQTEMDELAEELTRIAETTTYNNKIYPLAQEGVTKVQMPSGISEVTLTIVNDTGKDVECHGTVYRNGETMVLNDVAWFDTSYRCTYTHLQHFDSAGHPAGGGTNQSISSYGITYHLSTWYSGDVTPTPEDCEAMQCARVQYDTTDDEIKIQSSSLAYQSIDIPLVDAKASTLGVEFLDVMTHTYAAKAIDTINKAIDKVSEYRTMFGALSNRLEHAQANVDNTMLNTQDSESKIRDTDMAGEMVSHSAASIISQTAQSMLAQTNQMTQGVLKLLE